MRVGVRPKLASSDSDRSLSLGAVLVSNANRNWPLEGSNLRPLVDESVTSYWCYRFSAHHSSQTRIARSD